MKFHLHHSVSPEDLPNVIPRQFCARLPEMPAEPTHVVVFSNNRVTRSRSVTAAIAALPEQPEAPVVFVARVFTLEAKALLSARGAIVVTLNDMPYTESGESPWSL